MCSSGVYRFLGGDGKIRFHHPDDVSANVPTDTFGLPAEIAGIKDGLLARHRAEAEKRKAVFGNNPMIRLNQDDWDQDGPTEEIKRLRLDVGLTDYFAMRVTNSSMDERRPTANPSNAATPAPSTTSPARSSPIRWRPTCPS